MVLIAELAGKHSVTTVGKNKGGVGEECVHDFHVEAYGVSSMFDPVFYTVHNYLLWHNDHDVVGEFTRFQPISPC